VAPWLPGALAGIGWYRHATTRYAAIQAVSTSALGPSERLGLQILAAARGQFTAKGMAEGAQGRPRETKGALLGSGRLRLAHSM